MYGQSLFLWEVACQASMIHVSVRKLPVWLVKLHSHGHNKLLKSVLLNGT